MSDMRIEKDTFGPIEVPAARLWGAQTQRSLENFRIGEERMPPPSSVRSGSSSAPPPKSTRRSGCSTAGVPAQLSRPHKR